LIKSDQDNVIDEFKLEPFPILTLAMERTFIEKFCTLVKFSSQPDRDGTLSIDRLKNGVRHIYDLHLLLKEDRIQTFINGESKVDGLEFEEFIQRVLKNDLEGMRGEEGYNHYMNSNFTDCILFLDISKAWKELQPVYEGNFKRLLFQSNPGPSSEEIVSSLHLLKGLCKRFDQWKKINNITFEL